MTEGETFEDSFEDFHEQAKRDAVAILTMLKDWEARRALAGIIVAKDMIVRGYRVLGTEL